MGVYVGVLGIDTMIDIFFTGAPIKSFRVQDPALGSSTQALCGRTSYTSLSMALNFLSSNIRQHHKDYLKMGFSGTGEMDDPRLWCIVCGEKMSNEVMVPSRLKRHLFSKHSNLIDKNITYFQRLLKSQTQQSKNKPKIVYNLNSNYSIYSIST
ncbi:hypothetical protein QTP88_008632 [Uroleucon formosanum]